MSIAVTVTGASAIFGTLTLSYQYGLWGFIWLISGCIGLTILLILSSKLRYGELTFIKSQNRFFEILLALVILISWVLIISVQLKVLSSMLSTWLWGRYFAGFIVALTIGVYLYRGGQNAVIKSDNIQFFIMMLSLVVSVIVLLIKTPLSHVTYDNPEFLEKYSILAFLPVIFSYIVGPDIHGRLIGLPSQDRRKSIGVSILLISLFSLGLVIVGMLLQRVFPGVSPSKIPELIVLNVPDSLRWLILLGLTAAIMSSLDTTVFTATTICNENLLKNRPASSLTLPLILLLSLLTTFSNLGIIDLMMLSYNIYIGIMGVPLFMSLFRLRMPPENVFKGILFISVFFFGVSFYLNFKYYYIYSATPWAFYHIWLILSRMLQTSKI